ncbi:HEPN domain-containing protein [Frondihabitans sp. VKM Ac-2883]|uniref:HEPN domain-containing protein n=1 Tax=Frondihabitans sp. VKM Ac-2883 TaxID=2783823 RepID=UPI00188B6B25|nr:hypothetical protein [Frondihabitans sp. VKM Ac-2883]
MGDSRAYSTTLASLMEDVRRLLAFYPNANDSSETTDNEAGPLLRSAVVLLHTAWENYVEQLAVEGFIQGTGPTRSKSRSLVGSR